MLNGKKSANNVNGMLNLMYKCMRGNKYHTKIGATRIAILVHNQQGGARSGMHVFKTDSQHIARLYNPAWYTEVQ